MPDQMTHEALLSAGALFERGVFSLLHEPLGSGLVIETTL